MKCAALVAAALSLLSCKTEEVGRAPSPTTAAAPSKPDDDLVTTTHGAPPGLPAEVAALFGSGSIVVTTSGKAAAASTCPPEGAAQLEHCVWLSPGPGVTAMVLAQHMKVAGFPGEVEGEKVYAYWTPAKLEAFFGKKPTYMRTGGSSGGMVCLVVMPKGAKPAEKVRRFVGGWAIDDPVCEM